DAALPMYLRYATGWPPEQIDDVTRRLAAGELHPNAVKRLLGRTVVDLYHGADAGEAAEAEVNRVFKDHDIPTDMPEFRLPAGIRLEDALLETGLVSSRREAKRAIGVDHSVRIDGERATADVVLPGPEHVLQVGKRRWARVFVGNSPTV